MKDRRKPTDAELAILQVLWSRGASTVRDVAEAMGREDAYTTVLKLLQIMTEKGLVRRDESSRTHVYEAASSRDQTERQIAFGILNFAGEKRYVVPAVISPERAQHRGGESRQAAGRNRHSLARAAGIRLR